MPNVYIKIDRDYIDELIYNLNSVLKVLKKHHYPDDLTPEILTIGHLKSLLAKK